MNEATDLKMAQEMLTECEKQVEELTMSINFLNAMINKMS